MNILELLSNPNVRKYIYSVVAALLPVLIVAGVAIPPGMGDSLLVLVAALLGVGTPLLARANTPAEECESTSVYDSEHGLGDDSGSPSVGLEGERDARSRPMGGSSAV